jgi:amylosucrase
LLNEIIIQEKGTNGWGNIAGNMPYDLACHKRFAANIQAVNEQYNGLYGAIPESDLLFEELIKRINIAHHNRSAALRQSDEVKLKKGHWFLSNQLTGMSLYVDRFCGNLQNLCTKLPYFKKLGVNLLHLMPIFESPAGESDGGYAVSDFRKVDERFGTMEDLRLLQQKMAENGMYLMLDIVLNHTSHYHEWARKAKNGETAYQDYFYMYDDRTLPGQFEQTMPEIFPEAAPGSFTYIPECNKWAMTVFHNYQWDLNFTNPAVLIEMLDTIFFYANLGVDILRIDAPAFIWKQVGTSCQNLPQAHTLLQLIKQCVQIAAPGMALLGEAIVAPKEILNYFGTGDYAAKECDVAYGATNMALQWDALATGKVQVMLEAQSLILQKPFGTTWITYTRCHDDIGLGYDDYMIAATGANPYEHRKFLKDYYSGAYDGSPATGALFSVNPKTQDARISGSLASLCGLEKALEENNPAKMDIAVQKILLMQAHSFFAGGIPMLFYGDETGHTNDYTYLNDPGKSYDNRWMHRPLIDWYKNGLAEEVPGSTEHSIFESTQRLIAIRHQLPAFADYNNLQWIYPHNIHIAAFVRSLNEQRIYCIFNYSDKPAWLTWYAFKEKGNAPNKLYDHWQGKEYTVGRDDEYLVVEAYGFYVFEAEKK